MVRMTKLKRTRNIYTIWEHRTGHVFCVLPFVLSNNKCILHTVFLPLNESKKELRMKPGGVYILIVFFHFFKIMQSVQSCNLSSEDQNKKNAGLARDWQHRYRLWLVNLDDQAGGEAMHKFRHLWQESGKAVTGNVKGKVSWILLF